MKTKIRKITKVPGQLMLWRSGFGFDLVEYVEPLKSKEYYHRLELKTGRFKGMELVVIEYELCDITQEGYERYCQLIDGISKRFPISFFK